MALRNSPVRLVPCPRVAEIAIAILLHRVVVPSAILVILWRGVAWEIIGFPYRELAAISAVTIGIDRPVFRAVADQQFCLSVCLGRPEDQYQNVYRFRVRAMRVGRQD